VNMSKEVGWIVRRSPRIRTRSWYLGKSGNWISSPEKDSTEC